MTRSLETNSDGSGGGTVNQVDSQGYGVWQTQPTPTDTLATLQARLREAIAKLRLLTGNGDIPEALNPTCTFTRNLQLRDRGQDVQCLQQYLNTNGFILTQTGEGSPGLETDYFGTLTYTALIRFQEAHRDAILTPVGETTGTGYFGESTRRFILEKS